jgi:hypothetical protein
MPTPHRMLSLRPAEYWCEETMKHLLKYVLSSPNDDYSFAGAKIAHDVLSPVRFLLLPKNT